MRGRVMRCWLPALLLAQAAMSTMAVASGDQGNWRAACGALDGFGIRPRVSYSSDGGFKRCRSRAVAFGSAQPIRAALKYSVLSQDGVPSEARLMLEIRSPQDIQQAYARLRDAAAQMVGVLLGEPLPEAIGVAIMEGIFGREWALGAGTVALRRSGGSRSYTMEVRVYLR